MKKKLLSLVLAGAMVASTSVSAFAKTITDSDNTTPTTDVKITGQVLDKNGQVAASTFNVTIPTAASFIVDTQGNVSTAKINIQNNGTQNIDVYADKFVDTSVGTGINVGDENGLASNDRTYVSLSLAGNSKTLYLKSERESDRTDKHVGLYKGADLTDKATDEGDLKLAHIKSNGEYELTLSGKAGKGSTQIEAPINNDFTLTLKIKKSND